MKATFQLRERNNNQQPLIYLAVTLRGKRVRVATGVNCDKKKWSNGRPNRTQTLINHQLNELEGVVNHHLATSSNITPMSIKQIVHTWANKEQSSTSSIKVLIALYLEEKRRVVKPLTIKKIEFDLDEFNNFKPSKQVEDLNKELLKDFIHHLSELPKQTSTLNNYIKNLKAFLRWLWVNDYTGNDLTKYVVKLDVKVKEIIAITVDELKQLEHPVDKKGNPIELPAKLVRVKEVFLFGCYSGLRYSDLTRASISMVEDEVLTIRQQKTGNVVAIPLIHEAQKILTKNGGSLPTISLQKANQYIKELFALLEINRKVMVSSQVGNQLTDQHRPLNEVISFHIARKSFITIALSKGMHAKTVQAISGHKKDAIFNQYIAFSNDTLKNEMNKMSSVGSQLKVVKAG